MNENLEDATSIHLTRSNLKGFYAYQLYENQYKDEMAKIRYLINLIRFSEVTFIRNQEAFSGSKAARWLEFKLYKYPEEAKIAKDFIQNLAAYSKNTKQRYQIVFDDKKHYPMGDILMNELMRLEAFEKERLADQKTKEQKEGKEQESKMLTPSKSLEKMASQNSPLPTQTPMSNPGYPVAGKDSQYQSA